MTKNIAVIGCGPAGMISSIFSARNGHNVTIFEKNRSAGMKLLITGNGRCNISNNDLNIKKYHGENPKFVESVFYRFSLDDTRKFFSDIGIKFIEENEGRLYPRSERALDVLDALMNECKVSGCKILYGTNVKKINKISNGTFEVEYIASGKLGKKLFDEIILTTGGKTYSQLGSDGSGFKLAENLGHKIIAPVQVSVPIRSLDSICTDLQGVTVKAKVRFEIDKKKINEIYDDLIFTHYGLSGPAILGLSRDISINANRYKVSTNKMRLMIDFAPNIDQDSLYAEISKRIDTNNRMISNQFYQICAKSLVLYMLRSIDVDSQVMNISKAKLRELVQNIKRYELKIDELLDWDHAQFTAGGVDTKEIDSKTMSSKIIPGLYFAGEIVDIDGSTGGYNLQWAWSSGAVAGMSV